MGWSGEHSTADSALGPFLHRVRRRSCLTAHSKDRATGDPGIGEFADALVLFKAGEIPDDGLAS